MSSSMQAVAGVPGQCKHQSNLGTDHLTALSCSCEVLLLLASLASTQCHSTIKARVGTYSHAPSGPSSPYTLTRIACGYGILTLAFFSCRYADVTRPPASRWLCFPTGPTQTEGTRTRGQAQHLAQERCAARGVVPRAPAEPHRSAHGQAARCSTGRHNSFSPVWQPLPAGAAGGSLQQPVSRTLSVSV